MFERYTENARRAFNFAREEAVQYGSPSIESGHLLLGMLRENDALATRIAGETGSVKSLREEIEAKISVGQLSSSEMPVSTDTKEILTRAAEEAKHLGHKRIAQGHFLLGILSLDKCFAAKILEEHGVTYGTMREEAVLWAG